MSKEEAKLKADVVASGQEVRSPQANTVPTSKHLQRLQYMCATTCTA